jgi:hypothetical protein
MSQRQTYKKGMSTFCPACGSDIHFRRLPTRGSTVTCRECQSLLEVKRLAPLTLEWAFEEPFDDVDSGFDSYYEYRNKQGEEAFDLDQDSLNFTWEDAGEDDWAEEISDS